MKRPPLTPQSKRLDYTSPYTKGGADEYGNEIPNRPGAGNRGYTPDPDAMSNVEMAQALANSESHKKFLAETIAKQEQHT